LQQFCKLLKILAKYRAALAWRTVPPDNDGAVLSLLEDGIGPLYLHYIDDQRARLDSLGRHDLAEVFGKWQVYRMAAPAPATVSAVATAAAASAVAQGAALPSPHHFVLQRKVRERKMLQHAIRALHLRY
jgi:hypothetical protein